MTKKTAPLIFGFFIFCVFVLGIAVGWTGKKPIEKHSNIIYLTLTTILGGAAIQLGTKSLSNLIEDDIKKGTDEAVKEKIKGISQSFQDINKKLEFNAKSLGLQEEARQKMADIFLETEQKFRDHCEKSYDDAREIEKWLDEKKNRERLRRYLMQFVIRQYKIGRKYHKFLKEDIIGCISWLRYSIKRQYPLDTPQSEMEKLKKALRQGMPQASEIYRAALNEIKFYPNLHTRSKTPELIESYVNALAEGLSRDN